MYLEVSNAARSANPNIPQMNERIGFASGWDDGVPGGYESHFMAQEERAET